MSLSIRIVSVETREQMVHTRMPFRFGDAKLVSCPHLYLTATIQDAQGRTARGVAADHLMSRWFDKNPEKTPEEQLEDQRQVIAWSREAALQAGPASPFDLWLNIYRSIQGQAERSGLPALLGGFGPSLVERAMNDAVGRLLGLPFHALLRGDALGIDLGALDSSLQGIHPADLIPARPLDTVAVRHTVGLSDFVRTADIPDDDRVEDGLPQSLEEVIDFYGVRYFKLKVANRGAEDVDHLSAVAAVLDAKLGDRSYYCTLDGNEQYPSMEELLPLLEALWTRPDLNRLARSLIFLEQPIARSAALDADRMKGLDRIVERTPVIIDESDADLSSFPRALELGYSGTSHKSCKNTFKGLANIARARRWEAATGRPVILSAEDLTTLAPISLQEDLAALSALGITHAERNGHHYFRGLSHLSHEAQIQCFHAQPELYCDDGELVRLNIRDGNLDCSGLHRMAGLGVGTLPLLEV